ncbi:glucokinase [Methylovirgula sp. 4M-Z18]|uniref:glucokinase n=1 Tax=Methylovirgula sp. 4M-Z18 TaxID=2293567 RepID=UPI000E2EED12|nr:glucokinase [Methylovirgula sp. 4M-Z18]RFB79497.1 glucokinase [Methylovirgula sp. 4M-Z18]
MAASFPSPVLLCDIGGTNVRLSMAIEPGKPLTKPIRLHTADYPGLAEAIEAGLPQLPARPRSVIACGAGPVVERSLKLTNAPWLMQGADIAAALKLDQGLLLNDFEAQALALPAIQPEWTLPIGAVPPAHGARLILGPGTGLGIGALLDVDGLFVPVSSEACHIDFGPANADEEVFWPHVEPVLGRVTTESLMSGSGLARLHRARIASKGEPRPEVDGPAVVSQALADRGSEAAKTCAIFWRLIARFAGDMAITFIAKGGVTLAGGVLPHMVEFLDVAAFRTAFERKAPVDRLPKSIAVRLLLEPDAVLAGMAAIAAAPEKYALDYAARGWV